MKLVVAMSGASGIPLGVRILRALQEMGVEVHLIISKWAQAMIEWETDDTTIDIRALATHSYAHGDQAAPIASGSYRVDGMVVVPCSMKTLAAIRHGYSDTLIARTADVMIKERRPVVLVPREMPFSPIHLENMLALARAGVTIASPCPGFYTRPRNLDDALSQVAGRILDQFGLDMPGLVRWSGLPTSSTSAR